MMADRNTNKTAKPFARLPRLATGSAVLAIAATLFAPGAARAQGVAVQGNFVVTSGAATASRTPTVDTFFINSAEAVLTWTPFDSAIGGGDINFLPAGNTANFTSGTDFVVLNRVIPNDPSRAIAFNGFVNSLVNGVTGGTVWVYSPGGIVIGATSIFDVGNLVLTTNDIDTTGGLFGTGGEIRFRGAADSSSAVSVSPGAQIRALLDGSYVAMVAPVINQNGNVRVNGSIGYVAAESADITINSGLFDINILTGTSATGDAIVHGGDTNGPSSTGAGDNHAIYFVAMPKNTAVTMLVSGAVGYDPAAVAGVENGVIYLSAGGDSSGNPLITDYGAANGSGIAPDSSARGSIALDSLSATSRLQAFASDTLGIITSLGTANFAAPVTLLAGNTVLLESFGFDMDFAGDLTIHVNDVEQGGFVGIDLGTANLSVGGSLLIDVSDTTAGTDSLEQGGSVGFSMAGGNVTVGGDLTIDATGVGADSNDGAGGTINMDFSNGTIVTVNGATLVNALGQGGSAGNAPTGTGGLVELSLDNATFTGTGDMIFSVVGQGGSADAQSGDGIAGDLAILLQNGSLLSTPGTFTGTANSRGGDGTVFGTSGGNADGSAASVTVDIIDSQMIADTILLRAHGLGGNGGDNNFGGFGRAGRVDVTISSTGPASQMTANLIRVGALGLGGNAINGTTQTGNNGGDAFGGIVTMLVSGSGASVDSQSADPANLLELYADATGGNGSDSGDPTLPAGSGGGAEGGLVSLIIENGASVDFPNVELSAFGMGGMGGNYSDILGVGGSEGGNGGVGTGGTVQLNVVDGSLTATSLMAIADGNGGNGGSSDNGGGGAGVEGVGGDITLAFQGATTANVDFLSAAAGGSGGTGGSGVGAPGGVGFSGTGGSISMSIISGADVTTDSIDLSASGEGGNGGDGADGGDGDTGTGGDVSVSVNNASLSATFANISVNGDGGGGGLANDPGGIGGNAGTGRGGTVEVDLSNATIDIGGFDASASGGSEDAGNGGRGGDAFGGTIDFLMTGGTANFGSFNMQADSEAGGGGDSTTVAGGNGGIGSGGTLTMTIDGGIFTADFLDLSAKADIDGGDGGQSTNGDGGDAGDGTGGFLRLELRNGADVTANQLEIDVSGNAGAGGNGTGTGGDGGIGTGGNGQLFLRSGATLAATDIIINADGNGGGSGDGATVGTGGDGNGGNASLIGNSGSGSVNATTLTMSANGMGGGPAAGSGPSGFAGGGLVSLQSIGANMNFNSADLSATAMTGEGNAQGGVVAVNVVGAALTGGTANLDVGANATGGDALAGTIDVVFNDDVATGSPGIIDFGSGALLASAVAGGAGTATAGTVSIQNLNAGGGDIELDDFDIVILGDLPGGGLNIFNENGSVFSGTTDPFTMVGDIVVTAGGSIFVNQQVQTGQNIFLSADGAINITDLIMGNTVAMNSGSLNMSPASAVQAVDISISTLGNALIQDLDATASLAILANGLVTTRGLLTAPTILVASGDIDIGPTSNIFGDLVQFTNISGSTGYLGGASLPVASAYWLSQDELARSSATTLIFSTQGVPLGNVGMVIQDLTITKGADTGFILRDPGSNVFFVSEGSMRVEGLLQLLNADLTDQLLLVADETLHVVTPTGGIYVLDANGALSGSLDLFGATILVASDATAAALAGATSIAERDAILAINDGPVVEEGYIRANGMQLFGETGIYIQNSGTSNGDFDERAGFLVGGGGMLVASAGGTTELVINGRIRNPDGTTTTGAAVIDEIEIFTGFAAGSTVNGCDIADAASCQTAAPPPPTTPPPDPGPTPPDGPIPPESEGQQTVREIADDSDDGVGGDAPAGDDTSLVSLVGFEDPLEGPIIDDPVTGAGNEDLYLSNGETPCEVEEGEEPPEGCEARDEVEQPGSSSP